MSELLRRLSYPLTYLFLVSMCVIGIASHRGPVELGIGARLVMALIVPLQRAVILPIEKTSSIWTAYADLVHVREANEQQRQRIAKLEEENLQYREAIVSSDRFQRLAGFRAERKIPMLPANVVAQDLSPWFQSVIIDQGSHAKVRPGLPVITDSGVVGVVVGTTAQAAKVLLVVDPQSRVDAYIQRTRARGTVRGVARGECQLEQVLRDADLAEGDLVLTSGLGAVYPKGLVVGRVAEIERKPFGLFQSARITPAVDFRRLEEVFVILERRELPADADYATDDESLWPEARE